MKVGRALLLVIAESEGTLPFVFQYYSVAAVVAVGFLLRKRIAELLQPSIAVISLPRNLNNYLNLQRLLVSALALRRMHIR
ncbi:MAG: hypothetical protein CME36_02915 [unclassified Hahellaceae]|nr:hypothetical protein [Hahellaceae bacterium]